MVALFLKVVLWLCLIAVVLFGGVVAIGYCVYSKEKKDSVGWGVAIIARLGELAEQFALIKEGWDAANLTMTQVEILGKFVGGSEEIPEKVHKYLTIIQTPWMCGAASRLKEEVELMMKEQEELVDAFK